MFQYFSEYSGKYILSPRKWKH